MASPSILLLPFMCLWQGIQAFLSGLDRLLVQAATPFGVHLTDPRKRFAVLHGIYLVIYILGQLPLPVVPLIALAFGYIGVLAIGRAWVLNEKQRTLIVKKLRDGNPDEMPDLRSAALVSALQLLILFPILFQQLHRNFGLFRVEDGATFLSWFWFTLDKTYLKALPDWSALYNIHITSIEIITSWGRHVVLLSRLTFDYILIQGVIRLLAIRSTIREGVLASKTDPDMAVRLGKRAIGPLIEMLSDEDKVVRGAAANALVQLGDPRGVEMLTKALQK
jgi:hypothetical protein